MFITLILKGIEQCQIRQLMQFQMVSTVFKIQYNHRVTTPLQDRRSSSIPIFSCHLYITIMKIGFKIRHRSIRTALCLEMNITSKAGLEILGINCDQIHHNFQIKKALQSAKW